MRSTGAGFIQIARSPEARCTVLAGLGSADIRWWSTAPHNTHHTPEVDNHFSAAFGRSNVLTLLHDRVQQSVCPRLRTKMLEGRLFPPFSRSEWCAETLLLTVVEYHLCILGL